MSTFVYELLSTTSERWKEIPLLLDTANHSGSSDDLRDALCRAATVLVVAHFEGFLKDAAKAIIDDINKHSTFREAPSQIKRMFCRSFTGTGSTNTTKDDNDRETRLIELLSGLDTKIHSAPFTGGTSNPKPDVVERICGSLGAINFFALINESKLDVAFSGTESEVTDLLARMRSHIIAGVQEFPYKVKLSDFDMDRPHGKSRSGGAGGKATLWETFIDNLLEKRHTIAHGASTENRLSAKEIVHLHNRTQLLMHAALLAMCGMQFSKSSKGG